MANLKQKVVIEYVLVCFVLLIAASFYFFKPPESSKFPITPISNLNSPNVYPLKGIGPNGEVPNSVSSIINALKDLKVTDIQNKSYKVAIAMHDVNNDWSKAVLRGLKEALAYYGLEPIIITDGEMDIKKQLADYKNILSLKPDVLITLPVDSHDTSQALLQIQRSGVKIVFIDSVADGFTFPDKYQGWVVGDSYVLGASSAEILAKELDNKGKVALLLWKNKMFTVDQRAKGAIDKFKEYPNIEIVKEVYFEEFYQIKEPIEALLAEFPDLDGLWAVWDTPAFEAINVFKDKKADIKVTCIDMSSDVAKSIVNDDILIGTAADHPYDAGVGVALLSIAALENIELMDYYVVPAETITKDNIKQAWKNIYKQEFNLNN